MADYPVISRGIGRKPPSPIQAVNDIAVISLTNGFKVVVDLADVNIVAGYRWRAWVNARTGHAYAAAMRTGSAFSCTGNFYPLQVVSGLTIKMGTDSTTAA